ncbi:hypothetical protein LIER_33391 [Lithospermum erythrorhizon]|uniref:Uncharacterized protein n=1 Tax=Lithospermum erythrorhizon TaxID=34254 RepID=A0AAV3RWK1_LITER
MNHPRDGAAWKYLDNKYLDFANEPRKVRIGLCTNGFQAFSGKFGGNYSCWPVMICVYNFPPGMYMKDPYMMLSLICPGPDSLGRDLDVFLRPVVDELNCLFEVGVITYDAATRQNFNMRVSLMWTISDFPPYGMLSAWSTYGRLSCPYWLSCPYCMNATSAFYLKAVMTRHLIPDAIWETISELCNFSGTCHLQRSVLIMSFNYRRTLGPVQYRWMYRFEA